MTARAAQIRRAVMADSPALAELSAMLGYPTDGDSVLGRLERLLARAEDAVLVAERSGRVVGWIHGAEQELLESGRRCEILGLVVEAGHREQGVGRLLVAEIERWATGRGLDTMAVRSDVRRLESHPFYERLGYARVKTQHVYRKSLTRSG